MNEADASAAFAAALSAEDAEYLRAEQALLESAPAREDLATHLADEDPVARLLAQALLGESFAPDSPSMAADEYLDDAEKWFAPTILRTPPVRGVVAALTARFGNRLTEHMAVRLIKVPATPVWRAQAALGYLAVHPTPAVTEALLQYAAVTTVPALREEAVRVLTRSGDPNLAMKVAAERARLVRQGRDLPSELRLLA